MYATLMKRTLSMCSNRDHIRSFYWCFKMVSGLNINYETNIMFNLFFLFSKIYLKVKFREYFIAFRRTTWISIYFFMQELVNIFCIMNWIALNCITHSHKTTFHSDVLKQACIAKDESMVDTLFHAHTLNLGDFHSLLKNVEVCIENGFFFGIDIILSHLTKGRQRMLPGVSSAMCLCIKHNNLDFFQRIVSSDTFDSYREINIHSVIELCVAENKPAFFFSIVPKAETHEQEE